MYASIHRYAFLSAIALLANPAVSNGQTVPTIGGGYTNVIAIPVDDPATKVIGGALFKPVGAGPFPAVIFMAGCVGIDSPPNRALQAATADRLRAEGIATLI